MKTSPHIRSFRYFLIFPLGYAFAISFVINVLMLGTSVYSLQLLDRVLSSQSIETLIALSLIMGIVLGGIFALQMVRTVILIA